MIISQINETDNRTLYHFGQPLIHYITFIAIVLIFLLILFNNVDLLSDEVFILFGYIITFFPYIIFDTGYLFDYIKPLLFSLIAVSYLVGKYLKDNYLGFFSLMLIFLGLFGHTIWCQLVYGLNQPDIDFVLFMKAWK